MSSSEEELPVKIGGSRLIFVKLLKKYKVLLSKSMIPTIVQAKEKAWKDCKDEFIKTSGTNTTVEKLKKILNNMKTDVKKKTDKKVTGNKKIKLQEWEEEFLKLSDYEKNPVFVKIPGACSMGTENDKPNTSKHSTEINMGTQLTENNMDTQMPSPTRTVQKRPHKLILKQETDETKNLSTQELQRLVLLEQLNVARWQAKREQLMIDRLTNRPHHDPERNLERQEGSSGILSELREFINL